MQEIPVNIRKIAAAAGVSTASVSRAFQEPPSSKISGKLRAHILQICSEMHYVPNAHTRRMFTRRSDTVALLFPPGVAISPQKNEDTVDFNLAACLIGAQQTLASHGVGLLLNELTPDYILKQEYLRLIRSKAVDGILLWGVYSGQTWIQEILNEHIPLVMLQTWLPEFSCPHVIPDDHAGMKTLVEKILSAGHRHLALIPAPESSTAGRIRNSTVRSTLSLHGMEPAWEYGQQSYLYTAGFNALPEILEQDPPVTCVICSNDMVAWGCIEAARQKGLSIPGDLSIIGCDGLVLPGVPQITSYRLPSMEIGRKGAEYLLDRIAEKTIPEETLVSVTQIGGCTLAALT